MIKVNNVVQLEDSDASLDGYIKIEDVLWVDDSANQMRKCDLEIFGRILRLKVYDTDTNIVLGYLHVMNENIPKVIIHDKQEVFCAISLLGEKFTVQNKIVELLEEYFALVKNNHFYFEQVIGNVTNL